MNYSCLTSLPVLFVSLPSVSQFSLFHYKTINISNIFTYKQFISIQFTFFIDQLRALKGQTENCTINIHNFTNNTYTQEGKGCMIDRRTT